MLSCHWCREVIAARVSKEFHMDGRKQNPSSVMTKFLAHSVSCPLVKCFLSGRDMLETAPDFPECVLNDSMNR
jgi:hypothetical protein